MLAENRARVALDKEKIRKDYEKMSSQLSQILNNNDLANSFVQVSILNPKKYSYSFELNRLLLPLTEQ